MQNKKIYLACLLSIVFFLSKAQTPFTVGNMVVCRVGDGTIPFSSNTTYKVFLDEYTPAGVKVQTIALPNTRNGVNHALVLNPNIFTGLMTLSADGRYLALLGLDTIAGVTSTTPASIMPRTIALIKSDGTTNSSTALIDCGSGGSCKSVITSNGTDIWTATTGGTDLNSGVNTAGVRYTTIGSTTSVQVETKQTIFLQALQIVSGQLYCAASAGSPRLGSVGTGLPKVGTQALTALPGISTTGSYSQFIFFDENPTVNGVDVLYTVDATVGIEKYSFNGTAWLDNGSIGSSADPYSGLTGTISGNNVTLFATKNGSNDIAWGGGQLVKITDNTGYNGSVTTTPPITTILSDPNNSAPTTYPINTYSYRGVALVPQAITLPVNLVDISSTRSGSDIAIDWQTATEINTDHFEIQRSFNTVDFTEVGKLLAKGGNNDYAFIDKGVVSVAQQHGVGIVYYRLQMVDKDGSSTYSKIVAVKLNNVIQVMNAYPNPFTDAVIVNVNMGSTGVVNFTITDITGRTVRTMQTALIAGNNTVMIPGLEILGKGTYFLKAIIGEANSTIKLVK